jgi:YggT family protein
MTMTSQIINIVFLIYELLIVIRALLSWFPLEPETARHPLVALLNSATNPLVFICKEILYSIYRLLNVDEERLPVDLSPLLALMFLHLLRRILIELF